MMHFLQRFKTMPWQFCERLEKINKKDSNFSMELLYLGNEIDNLCIRHEAIVRSFYDEINQKDMKMGILKDLLEEALAHLKNNPEVEIIEKVIEDAAIAEGEKLIKDAEAKVEPSAQ